MLFYVLAVNSPIHFNIKTPTPFRCLSPILGLEAIHPKSMMLSRMMSLKAQMRKRKTKKTNQSFTLASKNLEVSRFLVSQK